MTFVTAAFSLENLQLKMITEINILGLRGFATAQKLVVSVPNGRSGSGLTVVVGANNAGKSTIIEAIRAIIQKTEPPSFTQGKRNHAAGDRVEISIVGTNGGTTKLRSAHAGTSETVFERFAGGADIDRVLALQSRRVFSPYFSRSEWNREQYIANVRLPPLRSSSIESFAYRLFVIQKNKTAFNRVLQHVIDPVPDWTIDQQEGGQHFLKVNKGGPFHSSEGLGEGIVSLLFIIDALYDSLPGDTIAIDEPELSLHPALQKKLSSLLVEYAKDRQILLATHSPYFISTAALSGGGTVARVHSTGSASRLSQLSRDTAQRLQPLLSNRNNPHIVGLNAQEVFFVEDGVVLVEGQDDVIFFEVVEKSAGIPLNGNFYGWGVGGAGNMETIAALLKELGFAKVVGILDGNQRERLQSLESLFTSYKFACLPADDIRTKPRTAARAEVTGLLNEANDSIRPEHLEPTRALLRSINDYLDTTTYRSAPETS